MIRWQKTKIIILKHPLFTPKQRIFMMKSRTLSHSQFMGLIRMMTKMKNLNQKMTKVKLVNWQHFTKEVQKTTRSQQQRNLSKKKRKEGFLILIQKNKRSHLPKSKNLKYNLLMKLKSKLLMRMTMRNLSQKKKRTNQNLTSARSLSNLKQKEKSWTCQDLKSINL